MEASRSRAGRSCCTPEQGFGDTLQFVRYANSSPSGGDVLLEVQAPLKSLLSGMRRRATYSRGESLPNFDQHCPLMSLPLALGTALDTIPAEVPYLLRPPTAWLDGVIAWATRCLRVGFVGRAVLVHKNDHQRSIALERLAALLAAPDIEFVSLQQRWCGGRVER